MPRAWNTDVREPNKTLTVAIILPARLKSTRLPDKLLLDRSGKTVLEHTIAQARKSLTRGFSARIVIAVDDERLFAIARQCGAEAVMTDPNHTSGTDRVAEAALKINDEIIVNLQADEPEIDPANIRIVAELLTAAGERAPMATLAVPIFDENTWKKPNVVKAVVSASGYAMYFSRAPLPYVRDANGNGNGADEWTIEGRHVHGLHHLGIYAYRREFLLAYKRLPPSRLEQLEKLEQLRALEAGHAIKVGLVGSNPPGIDTLEDYEAFLIREKNRNAATEMNQST